MELWNLLFVWMYGYVFSNIKKVHAEVRCSPYWDYLVSGPRGVPNHHLSASSSYNRFLAPMFGRLHVLYFCWAAGWNDKNPFIQVKFTKLKIVKGVVTQGRAEAARQWVMSYSVSYSTDNINWLMAKTSNNSEIFQGNSDTTEMKINFFSECVEAKYIRIQPKTWYGYCSIRFDVLGSTKLHDLNTKWKQHPISLNRNEIHRLSPISNIPSENQGVCAIRCYQHPNCLSYMFDSVRDTCEMYERQVFQGKLTDNNHHGGPKYFVNTAFLENHEYEIDETANICYKIYTWRTTSGQASKFCEKEKAKLISIINFAMIKSLQKSVGDNKILSKDPIYHVDGTYSNGKWSYHDGKEIPYTLWSDNEPKSITDNLTCVALTLSGLSTVDCTGRHGFVCGV